MLKEWSEFIMSFLTLLARLFSRSCSLCGIKFRLFSIRYRIENGFICSSCFEKIREEKEKVKEENKKIMREYIQKYLSNKDFEFQEKIELLPAIENFNLQPHSLEIAREKCHAGLKNLKTGQKGKSIDEIVSSKEIFDSYLIILDDLEKLFKLFKSKGIDTDYFKILSIFNEIITSEYNTAINDLSNSMYEILSNRLGGNISKEGLIRELIKIRQSLQQEEDIESNPEVISIYEISKKTDPNVRKEDIIQGLKKALQGKGIQFNIDQVSSLFNRFNLPHTKEEIEQLIQKIKEEIEIAEFEKKLGAQSKIDLGDFTDLSGHEFEEYIQRLFELLGYTAVRMPLTGDQGADLIIAKDNIKTVVQLKKYTGSISNKAIQEVVAAKNYYKADKTMVVTNTSFTEGAIDLALANNVELWDGGKIKEVISGLNKSH
jgi:hypothetical protein